MLASFILHLLVYVLAGKPNSQHDSADGEEDGKPLNKSNDNWLMPLLALCREVSGDIQESTNHSKREVSIAPNRSTRNWLGYHSLGEIKALQQHSSFTLSASSG